MGADGYGFLGKMIESKMIFSLCLLRLLWLKFSKMISSLCLLYLLVVILFEPRMGADGYGFLGKMIESKMIFSLCLLHLFVAKI